MDRAHGQQNRSTHQVFGITILGNRLRQLAPRSVRGAAHTELACITARA
jgi:hypothetical protein